MGRVIGFTNTGDRIKIPVGEGIPDVPRDDESVWHSRYRSIVNFERHLHANGTRIIKCFLHLPEEAQRKCFDRNP